ncbi:hypothetical protein Tco_0255970 [Tanacetum coccineum]
MRVRKKERESEKEREREGDREGDKEEEGEGEGRRRGGRGERRGIKKGMEKGEWRKGRGVIERELKREMRNDFDEFSFVVTDIQKRTITKAKWTKPSMRIERA